MLKSRLENLDRTLCRLHQTSPPSSHKYTHTSSQHHIDEPQGTTDYSHCSPNQRPIRPVNSVCSYHRGFNDRGLKCWSPSCPIYQQKQAKTPG